MDYLRGFLPLNLLTFIYSPWFISYLVIAFLICLFTFKKNNPIQPSLIKHLFPPSHYLRKDFLIDFFLYLLNKGLLTTTAFFTAWSLDLSRLTVDFFTQITTEVKTHNISSGWTFWIIAFLILLANDFAMFVTHYLRHKIPLLWELHKVHHSSLRLTPFAGLRNHPLEILFIMLFMFSLNTLISIALILFGVPVLKAFSTVASLKVFYFVTAHFRHSHIWLPFPKWLSYILISPAMHQIHHSLAPKHFHKNFGFIFTFWDSALKSAYIPTQPESLCMGVESTNPTGNLVTIFDIILRPINNSITLLSLKRRRGFTRVARHS